MVWPLWSECKKASHRWLLLGYLTLACTCILLTGSRSAFVGLCFLSFVGAGLSKYRVRLLALLLVAAPLIWFCLRDDLQNRFLTLIDSSYGPKNAEQSAEGRIEGWRNGIELWEKHRLLGVGPGNTGIATGKGFQSHELYAQVIGELGSVGAIAFVVVLFCFFRNYFEARRIGRNTLNNRKSFDVRLCQAVTMTVVLLMLMGLGAHNLFRYQWLWFGAFEAIALQNLKIAQLAWAGDSIAAYEWNQADQEDL
jgi:O-antigen ligase